MTRGLVALAVSTVALVALQISIISPLRVGGVVIMLVWLWPMALALTGSTGAAVVTGACAGLLFDAQAATPFGLSAIVGALLAWVISLLAREGVGDLDGAAWWVPLVLMGVGGFAAPLVYVVLAAITGHLDMWHASLGRMMILNATAFFVLARPVGRVAQRVMSAGGWARA